MAQTLANILPVNGTAYERTLASQVDQILALDAEAIRTLWNPMTCDIALLPYLAWALSVDLWRSDWSDTKKRSVVAASFANHKIKGTEQGIANYLDQVDCSLIRSVVPPARAYATASWTEADRLAWIAELPQIRIYPFLTKRTTPKSRAFFSSPGTIRSFYKGNLGESFMQVSKGPSLYGRQTFLYRNGVETEANYQVLSDVTSGRSPERIFITSTNSGVSYYGAKSSFFGKSFMTATVAASNAISIQVNQTAAQTFAVASGMRVVDVRPQLVYQTRIAPLGKSFLGAVKRQRFYTTTYGPRLVYDQIAILDPTILVPRKKTKYFYGYSRFGIEPFTAELLVEVPMTRPKSRMGNFYSGFMKKASLQKLDDALEAIHVSKSLRDTILVDTQLYNTVTLKDAMTLGTFKLGELLRV